MAMLLRYVCIVIKNHRGNLKLRVMKRNVLFTIMSVLAMLLSAPINASAAAGHTASIVSSSNVLCNGGNDGTATATVSGGTGPFGYEWTPGNIMGATATGLSAGTYTVTVTDSSDMSTATATVAITQPTALVLTPSVTSATCFGSCDGAAGVTASGGTPAYTFSWAPMGQTTAIINGLCAGTYTVIVTDANGCTAIQSMTVGQPGPLNAAASAIPETCAGNNDGQLSSNVTGGTGPYSYSWSPIGATTASVTNVSPGTYTLTVTDNYGCVSTSTTTVAPGSNLVLTPSSTTACFSMCDGSMGVSVSGGTAPYAYLWQPGNITTPVISNVCPGSYTVTVTDINGCTGTATITVTSGASMAPVASATPGQICAGDNSQLQVNATGAVAYLWMPSTALSSPTIFNPASTPAFTTTYTVTVTDANGCAETAITTVTVNQPPVVNIVHSPTLCTTTPGMLTANVTAGNPSAYTWSNLTTTPSITIVSSGTYFVDVLDLNGCTGTDTITVIDSCGWVWPGDADEDLAVNNNDVLAIGLGYGFTGPVRPSASISWTGQPAQDWNDTLPNGINLKYTDCNGDGLIDYSDTIAITQNYGLTHNYRLMEPVNILSNPNLYLVASMDSAGPQTAVNIDIMLGSAAIPVDSIYGLAYTLTFDPTLIDTNLSYISYSGSWMGTVGTDMIPFSKYFNASGFVDAAVTRIDHVNRAGYGKIGTFRIVTTDNLSGITPLDIDVTNVTAITARMAMLNVNTLGDTIVLDSSLTTGLAHHEIERMITLYPNPANSSVTFAMPSNTVNEMIISDMTGRAIIRIAHPAPYTSVDLSKLATGMYHVTMRTSQGNINKKLQVIR